MEVRPGPADSNVVNVLSPPVSRDLVVVGAGIVGASVAYHAARAGAVVTLVDAGRPGAGVTADSFAWIGASGVRTGPAAGLRVTATEEYRRLEAELPGLPVTWSGSLSWGAAGGAPEAGPGQEIVDAATVATLEPTLRQPPEWAVWAPGDGAVDPVGVTERLVAGARAHGARVHPDTPVTAVRRDAAGRVVGVETAAGPLSGATVVLAAGVATAALGAPLGIRVPVDPSPATLFRLRAPAGLVRTVVHNRDFDLRQVATDRLHRRCRLARTDSRRRPVHIPRRRERRAAQHQGRRTPHAGRRRADRRPGRRGARPLPGGDALGGHARPGRGPPGRAGTGRRHRRAGAGGLPPRPLLVDRRL